MFCRENKTWQESRVLICYNAYIMDKNTENNNVNVQPQPTQTVVNNPAPSAEPTIVTPTVDDSSYIDPTVEIKKEENPIKSNEETKSNEE